MSFLPLHKDAQHARKGQGFHAGLWYDRFFNGFLADAKQPGDDKKEKDAWTKGKSSWISCNATEVGAQTALDSFAKRQEKLIKACGGKTLEMRTQWNFVTGLGNNHPVENGFAWHHTLGVPYLTGAAVKGLVRAWCEVWEDFDSDKIRQWFGDTDQSGELIFFDAVPTGSVQLKADIMTPHYGDWYAKGDEAPRADGSNVPADWHDPNPVPFLVVAPGQKFQFGIAIRPGSDIDVSRAIEMLAKALEYLGAGAKTAAGYGRFGEDEASRASRAFREKDELAKQQALQREAEERKALEEARQARLEEEKRRREELAAMPVHERVLAEASDAVDAIRPRLEIHHEAYGDLRKTINDVLDSAPGWEVDLRHIAVAWVISTLDEHGWRHPDFKADKRKKWEKKMRQRLEELEKE